MNEHYAAVITDLRARRGKLQAELQDVEAAIAGIHRLVGDSSHEWAFSPQLSPNLSPQQTSAQQPAEVTHHPQARFANISVRWGVLWHLAEFAPGFEKTGEIANALLAGGYKSEAARFGNLVSAVLSTMKAKGEVETNDDGGYRLTDDGRRTWQLIRHGAKFKIATSGSEHSLLLVQ